MLIDSWHINKAVNAAIKHTAVPHNRGVHTHFRFDHILNWKVFISAHCNHWSLQYSTVWSRFWTRRLRMSHRGWSRWVGRGFRTKCSQNTGMADVDLHWRFTRYTTLKELLSCLNFLVFSDADDVSTINQISIKDGRWKPIQIVIVKKSKLAYGRLFTLMSFLNGTNCKQAKHTSIVMIIMGTFGNIWSLSLTGI